MIDRTDIAPGLSISRLVLGAMNLGDVTDTSESIRILDRAVAAGATTIDTADVYGSGASESVIGAWLSSRSGTRNRVQLASKVGMSTGGVTPPATHGRTHIRLSCEASLRRLGVEHLDLYQLHKPDFTADPLETLVALDDLVTDGLVRAIGTSSHPAWWLMELQHLAEANGLSPIRTEQPPFNLLDRRIENEVIPACLHAGISVITWSPLAAGLLAGRYAEGVPADSRANRKAAVAERITRSARPMADRFLDIAHAWGLDPASLAHSWVVSRPGVSAVIAGPRTLSHLDSAMAGLELELAPELLTELDDLVAPGSAVADFHNTSGWMGPLHPSPR